jgi:hypothetical protein
LAAIIKPVPPNVTDLEKKRAERARDVA